MVYVGRWAGVFSLRLFLTDTVASSNACMSVCVRVYLDWGYF